MNSSRLLKVGLVFLALSIPLRLYAGIYVYVDERGVKHYTNAPTDSRYRPAALPSLNTPRSSGSSFDYEGYGENFSIANDPPHYDHHIKKAAEEYMIDPLLIKAIIKVESDYNQYAISTKGAQGLMQLMPETARDLMVGNPYNAGENIRGGTRYLRKLLNAYDGDIARSLAAYNAGPSKVAKTGPLPRIRETRDYVRKVTRYYSLYRQADAATSSSRDKMKNLITVN